MRPPESWRNARVTLAVTALTVLSFLIVETAGLTIHSAYAAGFVPGRAALGGIEGALPFWLTPLGATFLHSGWPHLLLNLVILAFCGRAVEAVIGPGGFVVLYVLGAYAAAGAQYLVDPSSMVPMIGASGAISAVLGTYALMFGRNRVKVADPRLAQWLNALWLLAAWVILQAIVGWALSPLGIAIAAHIGGFVLGLALAYPLLLLRYRGA